MAEVTGRLLGVAGDEDPTRLPVKAIYGQKGRTKVGSVTGWNRKTQVATVEIDDVEMADFVSSAPKVKGLSMVLVAGSTEKGSFHVLRDKTTTRPQPYNQFFRSTSDGR